MHIFHMPQPSGFLASTKTEIGLALMYLLVIRYLLALPIHYTTFSVPTFWHTISFDPLFELLGFLTSSFLLSFIILPSIQINRH